MFSACNDSIFTSSKMLGFVEHASRLLVVDGEFHQVSLDESIYLAIHHPIHVSGLVVGAVVFHPSVIASIFA